MAAIFLPKCPQETVICISSSSWYPWGTALKHSSRFRKHTRNTKMSERDYTRSINTETKKHDLEKAKKTEEQRSMIMMMKKI